MHPIDIATFTKVLVTCLTDVFGRGGWDQPAHLLALRGSVDAPELEHVMRIPGRVADFLTTLLELGLRTGFGVHGLVLVAADFEKIDYVDALQVPLMALVAAACAQGGLSDEATLARLEETWEGLQEDPEGHPPGCPVLSVIGVLPDRTARVVTTREGHGLTVQDDLPAVHGDHDDVMELLLQLMRGGLARPRPGLTGAAGVIKTRRRTGGHVTPEEIAAGDTWIATGQGNVYTLSSIGFPCSFESAAGDGFGYPDSLDAHPASPAVASAVRARLHAMLATHPDAQECR